MNATENKSLTNDLLRCSILGVVRSCSVHVLIYPLEVIKIRLQSSQNDAILNIAKCIFQEMSFLGFYKGFSAQVIKTGVKQIWCWPLIYYFPQTIKDPSFNELHKQALTGLSIAMVDACISTPLERAKIVAIVSNRANNVFQNVYKNGYKGFFFHWMKLSVCWVSFLTTQQYLRDQKKLQKQTISLKDLMEIGVKTAFVVSFLAAPFDLLSTHGFLKSSSCKKMTSSKSLKVSLRTIPITFTALVVQNISSVFLIDRFLAQ